MTTKVVPGLLIATPDAAQAAREATGRMAKTLREAIRERGSATLALSGGSSPLDAYRLLAQETFDWSKIQIYWVDERAVPPDHERSNFGAAKKALLDAIAIPAENVHRMRGEASDLAIAASDYDATLRDTVKHKIAGLPSLDLVVLGVGDDGHTASLFPGDRTLHVTDRLVAAVPPKPEDKREARLTLTTPVLENARATVIIVLGAAKHAPLERIWSTSGDVNETPARIIRSFRGAITWVIDRAAGGMG
jgi:6-phosphogluconolactonase